MNGIKASSLLDVDAEFFAANIKNMLLDYEQENAEENNSSLVLKTITLENTAPYKTVYLPMFKAGKFPKSFSDDFPFSSDIMRILAEKKYGVGYGLSKNVGKDYFLEIEKYFIRNGLSFTQDEIIFTQSESDNGMPMSPSVYVRGIFSLISSEIKYETVNRPFGIHSEQAFKQVPRPKNLPEEYFLSNLLKFYLCPKYFYESQSQKTVFKDEFQLKFYASGIVYYKFFAKTAKAYPGKVFVNDSTLLDFQK